MKSHHSETSKKQRQKANIEYYQNKRHKQMEKHSMFMVRKNQYHENGHTAQSNLQIQCYPHQATNDLLHRTGKKLP